MKAYPQLELTEPGGAIKKVDYRQYTLNNKQQFAVLAVNLNKNLGLEVDPIDGINYEFIGKLNEQHFIFKQQIINSLLREDWDFDAFPNPEILFITVTKNLKQPVAQQSKSTSE